MVVGGVMSLHIKPTRCVQVRFGFDKKMLIPKLYVGTVPMFSSSLDIPTERYIFREIKVCKRYVFLKKKVCIRFVILQNIKVSNTCCSSY